MPTQSATLSDEQLVRNINCGKYDLFPELISRNMPHIKASALKWKSVFPDTEDLIQEGIMALFTAVKSFNEEKASFLTFAHLCIERAISAKAKSALAGKRIPSGLITSIDEGMSAQSESAEELVIRKDEDNRFNRSVESVLSELEYNVLSLFLNGESYSDIAEKLGVSPKSVDSALQRIRKKIKK